MATIIQLKTSQGEIDLELYTHHAPKVSLTLSNEIFTNIIINQTCNNFSKLCQSGYYNGCIFHRIM